MAGPKLPQHWMGQVESKTKSSRPVYADMVFKSSQQWKVHHISFDKELKFEKYLCKLLPSVYIPLCKYRLSNHKLPIEKKTFYEHRKAGQEMSLL